MAIEPDIQAIMDARDHQYTSYLGFAQMLARLARKMPPGRPMSLFWQELVQEAGIDLFAGGQRDAEDLTYSELLTVMHFLYDELGQRILKIEGRIDEKTKTRVSDREKP